MAQGAGTVNAKQLPAKAGHGLNSAAWFGAFEVLKSRGSNGKMSIGGWPVQNGPCDSSEALAKLIAGNGRFSRGRARGPNRGLRRRRSTFRGQRPFAAVVTCSDSRVSPELLFDRGIGDLFVVRTAGNVLDKACLASLEFAVERLGLSLVVVLGHTRCGAVTAALEGQETAGARAWLLRALAPAIREARLTPGDPVLNAVTANVNRTAQALRSHTPILSERVRDARLRIVRACYDLATGRVMFHAD